MYRDLAASVGVGAMRGGGPLEFPYNTHVPRERNACNEDYRVGCGGVGGGEGGRLFLRK